jgi:hypothetical protein
MAKRVTKKQAVGWTASKISETDLLKAREEGFPAASVEIIFPSPDIIPEPQDSYRVMFLAFLPHGFSLPAHEFLCGILFVYGMQLHQLTPNLLLHIARFITLCEAFIGINPHWGLWKCLFHLHRNASKDEIHYLGGTIVSVCSESQYLKFEMAHSIQGWRQKMVLLQGSEIF